MPSKTMPVHRSFRFRIYPSRAQAERLCAWENALRFLWNLAHEQRLLGIARTDKVSPSKFAQCRELTELRSELPWLADVPRQACWAVLRRLGEAWENRWRLQKPHFKKKHIDVVSAEIDVRHVFWLPGRHIRCPKLGRVHMSAHRELIGRTVRVMLVRDCDQWFAVFVQEVERQPAERRTGTVGIDRGVVAIIADSEGQTITNPAFAGRAKRKLVRIQRALSRTKKASNNRAKARLRLARAHRKVRRQRAWLQHQISHDYANSHGVVVIEKLETARMTRSARGTVEAPGRNVRAKAGLNRSILDAGWSGLADKLRYKLEERGGLLVEVPAAYSSQTCSVCGVVDAASRRTQAEFSCVACGHSENADINAARVILSRWSPPVQPVEASHAAA